MRVQVQLLVPAHRCVVTTTAALPRRRVGFSRHHQDPEVRRCKLASTRKMRNAKFEMCTGCEPVRHGVLLSADTCVSVPHGARRRRVYFASPHCFALCFFSLSRARGFASSVGLPGRLLLTLSVRMWYFVFLHARRLPPSCSDFRAGREDSRPGPFL